MRRIPLWLTVVPLAIGLVVYWFVWSGYRDDLRADIGRVLPGATVTIGGFPYRMEAEVAAPRYARRDGVTLALAAKRAIVNRTPWQRALTIVRSDAPHAEVVISALPGATVRIDAASAVSSLHLDADGRVARQSNVFTAARAALGVLPVPVTAATLEVHLRETPARSNEAWSATPPQRAQVVLAGTGVRLGQGAPLTLAADIGVTAAAPLRSYAGWADGGTVEIAPLTLADASGEVVRLTASIVPARGGPTLAGTISTVCPATVAAALAGAPRPSEQRVRLPIRLAIGGPLGAVRVLGDVPPPRAVRAQLPPCPALR